MTPHDPPVARQPQVFADGGSRGNPGPAGYGAVVFGPDGEVLAERAASIGIATNNVAEYSGLIAGLQAALELGIDAISVRMDSKLVIEQVSGRWKVKHPDMKPLARQAASLITQFREIDFEWVPRARNSHADRLANEAMDAAAEGREWTARSGPAATATVLDEPAAPLDETPASPEAEAAERLADEPTDRDLRPTLQDPAAALPAPRDGATTFVVVRHGETTWGAEARFTGRQDVPLTDRGRRQADAVAQRIRRLQPSVVLTSPLRRCRDTAEAIAAGVGAPVVVDDRLLDGLLGEWTGYRSVEIQERWPDEFAAWRSDPDARPPGGESFTEIRDRVRPVLPDALAAYRGHGVVLVTHAATAKMIMAIALNVPSTIAYRIRMDTASLSGFTVEAEGAVVVWGVNETGHLSG